jgi:pimeloyl-ACP methyl ester carboxylesterase
VLAEETIQVRVYGSSDWPTLVYLPGLHADWTLVASFREAIKERLRFAEFTYPRTTKWTLNDYANAVTTTLLEHGIRNAWILAESFSSQVAWPILASSSKRGFDVQGVVLAGGFVRHPAMFLVPIARFLNRRTPMRALTMFCAVYRTYARFRHRHASETLREVDDFVLRRSQSRDRDAICSRYDLIQRADFRLVAAATTIPIYQLTGLIDPIVPWPGVRRWLRKNCRAYRGSRIILDADHNVLGTAPQTSADQIWQWMNNHRAA